MIFRENEDVTIQMSSDEFILLQKLLHRLVQENGPNDIVDNWVSDLLARIQESFPEGHYLRANLDRGDVCIDEHYFSIQIDEIPLHYL